MSATTKIAWTKHSASPWHGCAHGTYIDAEGNEHEHIGCGRCYAERMAKRNPSTLGVWGKDGTRVMSASFHQNCRRWNALADKAGKRASVFPSICDPFEQWDGPILNAKGHKGFRRDGDIRWHSTPADEEYLSMQGMHPLTMDDLRRDLFATIDACPHLDFLLLTKRPGNVRKMWPQRYPVDSLGHNSALKSKWVRSNVFLLTSVSDQATAEALIQPLLLCADLVPVLGISLEPMLARVDFDDVSYPVFDYDTYTDCLTKTGKQRVRGLNWVIVGSESNGKRAGRFADGYPDAARAVIEQCGEANVPCFHKQMPINGLISHDPSEWPEWARVQEFPNIP